MPLIIPANTLSAAGYNINNSCRFNDDDTPKLTRSIGSDGSLVACTINVWAKLGSPQGTKSIIWTYVSGTNANLKFGGESGLGELHFYSNRTGESPAEPELLTDTFHRDPSAWYNIHAVWDSANGTEGDRMRLYLNGTRLTSFDATSAYPQQNGDFGLFNYTDGARTINISNKPYGGANHFDGYLANIIVCDGQTYEPTKFGEFDSDSPTIWKPIDPAEQSLNFGTHGFWLDFADSSALGNDVSGNNNDFTVTNLAAIDQCSDSPTNNFCTLNPLDNYYDPATFSEGNLSITTETDGRSFKTGTFGVSKGKWYWEIFRRNANGHTELGIAGMPSDAADDHLGKDAFTYAVHSDNGNWFTNDSGSSFVSAHNSGGTYPDHVVSIALDLDNNKFYFGINGTWENSGDPTSGATGTGAKAIAAASTTPTGLWFPAVSDKHNAYNIQLDMNFGGTSAFGATAVASANQDGNGYGNFEFAVPSGYYALCTKNLAEFG